MLKSDMLTSIRPNPNITEPILTTNIGKIPLNPIEKIIVPNMRTFIPSEGKEKKTDLC